ncbi:hypothetical protein [Cupriavidus pampae]|uniref:Uncharacterized protein n=1 Tax=Cupriavidus pampae TaxID=659251 RepID=A0ABN7ZCQ0_9BURK|nr:hypothetical protein [Cupriavidus pampae]CAG9183394.1 hypothetical protein LMG32289_05366 [Cupriavidus pampae]
MILTYRSLPSVCVCHPLLRLPARDRFGVVMGGEYRHDLFAPLHRRRYCCAGKTQDLKGGQPFVFLGRKLLALDFLLKMNPYILETRCFYPLIRPRQTTAECRTTPPCVIVDRMLTVVLRENPQTYHLHAMFLSQAKLEAAAPMLEQASATMERIRMEQFSQMEIHNAAQCYQWVRGSDIRELEAEAEDFAYQLSRSHAQGTLDARLRRLARQRHADCNHLYRLLAAALAFGQLTLDDAFALRPSCSLVLRSRGDCCDR